MAFDVLSFLIGQQAVKGTGGSGSDVTIVAKKGTFISDGTTQGWNLPIWAPVRI